MAIFLIIIRYHFNLNRKVNFHFTYGKESIDGPRFGGSGMVKGDPTNLIGVANG